MATLFTAGSLLSASYRGLKRIFEFTNDDRANVRTQFGQAAGATLLAQQGILERDAAMASVERLFPPDILGGYLGTSRSQIIKMCRLFGLRLREIRGETALRECLTSRQPVLVMLGVSAGRFWKFDLPGG